MSELLKYVLARFQGFTVAEYLVLLFATLVVAAAVIALLRWLFESRYKAQHELIQLKDALLSGIREQLELATAEASRLTEEATTYRASAEKAQRERDELDAKVKRAPELESLAKQYASDFDSVIVLARFALFNNLRLVQLYQILSLYQRLDVPSRVPGTPTAESLFARLHSLYNQFRGVPAIFDALRIEQRPPAQAMALEILNAQILPTAADKELDELWETIHGGVDKAITSLKSGP